MRTRIRVAFPLFIAILLTGATIRLSAAQQIDPKQYFEKDYAVAPAYRPNENGAQMQEGVRAPSGSRPPGTSSGSSGGGRESQPIPSLAGAAQQNPAGGPGAVPTYTYPKTRVSVVVNSLDVKHLESVVHKVVSLAQAKRSNITGLIHIGDPKNMTQQMTDSLRALDIGVAYAEVLPADLNISTSPTWIFETNEGKYIVEGSLDPERFISPSGDYLAPVLGSASVPSIQKPEIKIEGLQ